MRREGRSVLVVDDDRMNRLVLSKLLERDGYRLRTAVDGIEALAALSEEAFDAVLLDIVMPELDGLEVLSRVKADPRLWHIPVIMISAVDDTDRIVACLELGADDYVQKPFDPVLLGARLGACLARRRFHVLEVEYHKMVQEQADELDSLKRSLDAPAAVAPHRGSVAVLVTGLGGVGAFVGEADPGEVLTVLDGFHSTVAALAERFGGALAARAGDACTLVFNGSLACPEPAAAAVATALALGEAMAARLAGGRGDDRARAGVRWGAGIGLGEAAVGLVGHGDRQGLVAAGPVVDRASWLGERGRREGAVLVDEATAEATRHLTDVEAAPDVPVRSEAAAWRLVGLRPPPSGEGPGRAR